MITKEELIKVLDILDNTYGVNDGGIAGWDDEDKEYIAEGILKQLDSGTEPYIIFIEYESNEYDRLFPDFELKDYEKLVGKCFMCDNRWAIKVVGLDPNNIYEFLYERYDYYNGSWNVQDYIWLQDTAERDPKYKKYCLTPQTEKNVASEDMFHLGSDGNLYESIDCDAFYKYTPMDSVRFEEIKKQALENDKE